MLRGAQGCTTAKMDHSAENGRDGYQVSAEYQRHKDTVIGVSVSGIDYRNRLKVVSMDRTGLHSWVEGSDRPNHNNSTPFPEHERDLVQCLCHIPELHVYLAGGVGMLARVYDAGSLECLQAIAVPQATFLSLAWSSATNRLFSASTEKCLMWRFEAMERDGKAIYSLLMERELKSEERSERSGWISKIALDKDGLMLAVLRGPDICCHCTHTGQLLYRIDDPSEASVGACLYIPDTHQFVTGNNLGHVLVWYCCQSSSLGSKRRKRNRRRGRRRAHLRNTHRLTKTKMILLKAFDRTGHDGAVTALVQDENEEVVISSSLDGTLRLYNVDLLIQLAEIDAIEPVLHMIGCPALAGQGGAGGFKLVCASASCCIRVWESKKMACHMGNTPAAGKRMRYLPGAGVIDACDASASNGDAQGGSILVEMQGGLWGMVPENMIGGDTLPPAEGREADPFWCKAPLSSLAGGYHALTYLTSCQVMCCLDAEGRAVDRFDCSHNPARELPPFKLLSNHWGCAVTMCFINSVPTMAAADMRLIMNNRGGHHRHDVETEELLAIGTRTGNLLVLEAGRGTGHQVASMEGLFHSFLKVRFSGDTQEGLGVLLCLGHDRCQKMQMYGLLLPSLDQAFAFSLDEAPSCLSVAPSHRAMAMGYSEGTLQLLAYNDLRSNGKVTDIQTTDLLSHHTAAINDISFSEGGTCWVSCSIDGTIKMWSYQGIVLGGMAIQGGVCSTCYIDHLEQLVVAQPTALICLSWAPPAPAVLDIEEKDDTYFEADDASCQSYGSGESGGSIGGSGGSGAAYAKIGMEDDASTESSLHLAEATGSSEGMLTCGSADLQERNQSQGASTREKPQTSHNHNHSLRHDSFAQGQRNSVLVPVPPTLHGEASTKGRIRASIREEFLNCMARQTTETRDEAPPVKHSRGQPKQLGEGKRMVLGGFHDQAHSSKVAAAQPKAESMVKAKLSTRQEKPNKLSKGPRGNFAMMQGSATTYPCAPTQPLLSRTLQYQTVFSKDAVRGDDSMAANASNLTAGVDAADGTGSKICALHDANDCADADANAAQDQVDALSRDGEVSFDSHIPLIELRVPEPLCAADEDVSSAAGLYSTIAAMTSVKAKGKDNLNVQGMGARPPSLGALSYLSQLSCSVLGLQENSHRKKNTGSGRSRSSKSKANAEGKLRRVIGKFQGDDINAQHTRSSRNQIYCSCMLRFWLKLPSQVTALAPPHLLW
ncbi:unnamed protein product [Chrysoparadoxa australica]